MEMVRFDMAISQADKDALRQLAVLEGESMSVLVRQILRYELRRRGLLSDCQPDLDVENSIESGRHDGT
jgi:hypothetical protein